MLEKYRSRKYAWLSAAAVLFILIGLAGTEVVLHPGKYLFNIYGDSIKNYYVVAYFVKYNGGLHFTGMNYPFGELPLFTDNQPLFSVPLAWVHRHLWPIAEYVTAAQNIFVFVSFAIGAWFMQRILLRLHLPAWYATLSAVIMVLMSPQHVQPDTQYALTYSFTLIIPWFLLIRFLEEKGSWQWWGLYVLFSLAFGFIHVYFLAINGLFGVGVALTYAVQEKQRKIPVQLFLGALLPSVLFLLFTKLVDTVPDRPQHPEGFFLFRGNLEGIFWPNDLYFLPFLQKFFPWLQNSRQVSYAYAGVAGAFCVLYFLIKGARYLVKRQWWRVVKPVLPAPLRWAAWAAVGSLLFSLAIPFKYGLQELVYQSPFLEQFRVLCRFSWQFYYVYAALTAYFFYALYRWLRQQHRPKLAVSLLAAFLASWMADAVFFLKPHVDSLTEYPVGNSFHGREHSLEAAFRQHGYRPEQFQALVPLPYFCIGSEKVDIGYFYHSIYNAMRVSLQTGLPMATMMMARTSQSQAFLQAQLLSSDLIEKTLLAQLPNAKPFLVMTTPEKLRPEEERLRQKAKFLFQADSLSFYELPLAALRTDARPAVVQQFKDRAASYHQQGPLWLSQNTSVFWKGVGKENRGGIFGTGEWRVKKGPLVLWEDALPVSQDTAWEASVWVNAQSERTLATWHYEQLDAQGQVLAQQTIPKGSSLEIFGSWVKIDLSFKRLPQGQKIKIWLEGDDIWASSFLLKPAGTDVYWPLPHHMLLYNNYLVQGKAPWQ